MRKPIACAALVLVFVACERPDLAHDGFVLVDHEARTNALS
jgi:hypothetical protein